MVQGTGWRSIFMVNVPVGLVAMALTWRFVAESRDERPRTFDIPGQLLFMTTVGAFAFAVIEGPHAGWLSGKILTLFVVAGAALAAFILCERWNADPMMDLKLFGDRTYSLAIITIFAALFACVWDVARDYAVHAERARFLADGCGVPASCRTA